MIEDAIDSSVKIDGAHEVVLETEGWGSDVFSEWQAPIPLINTVMTESAVYPVGALPPLIQNAVVNYQQYGQQPLPLIACSALANVSLACQTLANVARDKVLVSPVSLYFMVVAGSGERKSAADHTFSSAVRIWERNASEQIAPNVKKANSLHEAWFHEKESVIKKIKKARIIGDINLLNHLRQQFLEIMESEPKVPLVPRLIFEDATQESMASHLSEGWGSASLWSDEGGIVFAGSGMQNNAAKFVAFLNRLWDGKDFITHRKTSRSFTISNRRITVSLMLQPLILKQLIKKNGGINRQSGFLARTLIAYPESEMGKRKYQEPHQNLNILESFNQRLTECLNMSLSMDIAGCKNLPILHFSTKAKTSWVNYFNRIEKGLEKLHQWGLIKDFASKSAENAARLSALFHLFEGKEGDIRHESVERATEVMEWHLIEARRVLESRPASKSDEDAMKLLGWIRERKLQKTSPRHLLQFGPIRQKSRRDKAIDTLIENHYLQAIVKERRTVLMVNPEISN